MNDFKKDILKICKKHFSIVHESTFDAIRAYQAKWSGSEISHITDEDILDFMYMIADEFLTAEDYKEMIKDRMMKDYGKAFMRPFEMSYRYMSELYIRQLCSLQVKDGDNWIIDLSDYKDGENII